MVQVVWFKRDLRIEDHRPLVEACARGPVLALYVFEPDLMLADDFSAQHYGFLKENLICLDRRLNTLGLTLTLRHGPILEVLNNLVDELGVFSLLSHEETGNGQTYRRDRAVSAWCRARGVAWAEFESNGVVRRLKNRDRWASLWLARMTPLPLDSPRQVEPVRLKHAVQEWPHKLGSASFTQLMRRDSDKPARQVGGIAHAKRYLDTFVEGRGADYRRAMSGPLSAQDACSRLSPYLALGVLSIRQVTHALSQAQDRWRGLGPAHTPSGLLASLKSFESRLHWHCHFMQKLESDPTMEFRNLHHAYDGLREEQCDPQKLAAWRKGETGYPMIDACMRMLLNTGWINFRMRAMLASFSSYQLWQHWREPSLHLARQFLDYEPGIHYPQMQMQSGTTGINTIRIYNPVKQARDHDPEGVFVQRWIPELQGLPLAYLFEPWTTPRLIQEQAGCLLGRDYPLPIIDLQSATRYARESVWGVRKGRDFRDEAQAIFEKHGSRQSRRESQRPQQAQKVASPTPSPQLDLFS
jgi:deoxyribodipyrimidine photo-lyase